jgi:linoleoyl-CoA desaturase
MVYKTVLMLILFFAPILILNLGLVTSLPALFGLFVLAGLGQAGIGMGIMHDANHGSYSKNRRVNKIMGYSMNLIGANANLWKVQHNVLHHTYTNVDDVDDDINVPFVLRISPHAKRYWWHRYQHFYAWFFYGLSTLAWTFSKDFVNVFRYGRMGLFNTRNKLSLEFLKVLAWKLVYISYTLIIPLIVLPVNPLYVILGFVSMHFVTGLGLSIIFQTAHIMPSTEFPLPDKQGRIDNEWALHQMLTTSNFSPRSRIFTWLIGGLNYQIEHHLLPNICHIHYKKLSGIVSSTAAEFGIPYYSKRTFIAAVWDHLKMLKQLGKVELTTHSN